MQRIQLAALMVIFASTAFGVSIDSTRAEVVAELGKPRSSAVMGDQEILQYANGVRIELTRGHVSGARGVVLSVAAPPVEADVMPATSPQPATAIPPIATATTPAPTPTSAAPQSTTIETTHEKSPSRAPDALGEEFNQAATKTQASLEKTLDAAIAEQKSPTPFIAQKAFDPLRFATQLLLKCLMTVLALKLACKYWGADVFWSSILTVAVVDAVVRAGLVYLGQKLLGFPTLFYADDAIGGIVMVLLLRQLSINRSINQAIQLVLTTKTFTVIVGAFLISVLMSRMH